MRLDDGSVEERDLQDDDPVTGDEDPGDRGVDGDVAGGGGGGDDDDDVMPPGR